MKILGLLIIALTMAGAAVGRFPGFRMNRASIAVVGASALLGLGILTPQEAYASVDPGTLLVLFSLMIININLRLAGFFRLVTAGIVRMARTPRQLLAMIVAAAGLLSAFFLNDTVVLMLTPLVLEVASASAMNPIPLLVGLVTAANMGSAATMIGNPQNMVIGMSSGLSFREFSTYLAPVALGGLFIIWSAVVLLYRADFPSRGQLKIRVDSRARIHPPLLLKGIASIGFLIGSQMLGFALPVAALSAASFLLITRRLKPQRIFREVDWSLLVFFSGLFVVTGALTTLGLTTDLRGSLQSTLNLGPVPLGLTAAVLSNIVSNVPAVMLLRPFVSTLSDPTGAWLTLAMATTLAGNLTLLGSAANIIVAEGAQAQGVRLSFREYLRVGIPVTVLSLGLGLLWLGLVR